MLSLIANKKSLSRLTQLLELHVPHSSRPNEAGVRILLPSSVNARWCVVVDLSILCHP